MALHFKSNRSFLIIIGISAFFITIMAALFSITGVSALFSGELKTIAIMMGVLEFAKIILASYLATYWEKLSKLLRTYFITAVLVLMVITSAGIFGYLSDAYQGTKGNYEQVDQSVKTEQIRLNFYDKEIKDNESRIAELRNMKRTYQLQIDSLIARNRSTYAVERALTYNDKEVTDLRKKNSVYNDSLAVIKLRIAEKESINSSGKLGPLRYMADVFGTSMDNVVKWFILVLIFVFDPLAVLLFVSMATILRKDKQVESKKTFPIPSEDVDVFDKNIPQEKRTFTIDIKPVDNPQQFMKEVADKIKNSPVFAEGVMRTTTGSAEPLSFKRINMDQVPLVDPKTGEYNLKFNKVELTDDFWLGTPAPTTSSEKPEQLESQAEPLKKSEEVSSNGSPEVKITETVVTRPEPQGPPEVSWHTSNWVPPKR